MTYENTETGAIVHVATLGRVGRVSVGESCCKNHKARKAGAVANGKFFGDSDEINSDETVIALAFAAGHIKSTFAQLKAVG